MPAAGVVAPAGTKERKVAPNRACSGRAGWRSWRCQQKLARQRTLALQDWVAGFGWECTLSVKGWLLTDAPLISAIGRDAQAMQRRCRRFVNEHGLKEALGGRRGGAADLYWAAVAAMKESGGFVPGTLRRGAKNHAQRSADDWGVDTARDQFWELKLKEGPLCDATTEDGDATWQHAPERADAQTGLLATQLYEIRRRVRAQGPDPLAQPEWQIHRTGAQLQAASRRCRKVTIATAKQIDIALTVEIAAGRITTDDGLPTTAEVRRLVHGSAGLPDGAFELLPEQADVIEEMWNGTQIWLEWPPLETEHTGPLESQYRRVDLEQTADWRRRVRWKSVAFGDLTDAQLAQRMITMRLEQPHNSTLISAGLSVQEWHIYVSCLCMEGFMVRKHTLATLRTRPTMRGLWSGAADCRTTSTRRRRPAGCSFRLCHSTNDAMSLTSATFDLGRVSVLSSTMSWGNRHRSL